MKSYTKLKQVDSEYLQELYRSGKNQVAWESPSNIAIVKYWGKKGLQLPSNASLSFTLDSCKTKTYLTWWPKKEIDSKVSLELFFHDERNEKFENKVRQYFESLITYYPFLTQLHFKIRTSNTFPHSAGIASSASGMSALALCLGELEQIFYKTLGVDDTNGTKNEFDKKVSFIARLGSGSACRSLFKEAALWGEFEDIGCDEYAVETSSLMHEVFKSFKDTILIVSKDEKSVSSRAGHALMQNHPFAKTRFKHAKENLQKLMQVLSVGDVHGFGEILENEALELHGLMMNSYPSFILMHPNSLKIIQEIREYRNSTGEPVYFTLDAGPNIHLLYPLSIAGSVLEFIKSKLAPLCVDGIYIEDQVGSGPKRLSI